MINLELQLFIFLLLDYWIKEGGGEVSLKYFWEAEVYFDLNLEAKEWCWIQEELGNLWGFIKEVTDSRIAEAAKKERSEWLEEVG